MRLFHTLSPLLTISIELIGCEGLDAYCPEDFCGKITVRLAGLSKVEDCWSFTGRAFLKPVMKYSLGKDC